MSCITLTTFEWLKADIGLWSIRENVDRKGILMRTTLLALCLLVAGSLSSAAPAVTGVPEDVIKATAESVLNRIKEDREGLGADPARLYQLVDE